MNHSRTAQMDAFGEAMPANLTGALELFAFVDALKANGSLRRAITDPMLQADRRGGFVTELIGDRLGVPTVAMIVEAVGLDWPNGLSLAAGLERQAARVALRSTDPDVVRGELNTVREAVASDGELRAAFGRPGGDADSRAQLVRSLIGGRADEVTTALTVRAAQQGSGMLHELVEYMELTSQVRGHRLARATVARPLPSDQAQRLAAQLSRIFATPVDLVEQVDPAVLGGVRVQVGHDVIDGTVRATVEQAARELA